MTITIKSRWNSEVTVFASETATTVREAVLEALATRNVLRGADLRGAVLSGADLRGAVLSGADLRGADLSDADLSDAVLRGADLRGAVLSDAVLSDADLSDADLRGAVLRGADLRGAVLSGADLRGADWTNAIGLTTESFTGKMAEALPVPKITSIHQHVCEAIKAQGCSLAMGQWHTCDTTHCRAGWVVHLAGKQGKALEARHGTATAARSIVYESDPSFDRPLYFYRMDDAFVMKEIEQCAEREKAAQTTSA